jgi:hypothetical protein
MPTYLKRTLLLVTVIRKINARDVDLTPKEQAKAIKKLDGLPTYQMQRLAKQTGPKLAESIRKLISPHRARNNRTQKDRA